MISERCIFFHL